MELKENKVPLEDAKFRKIYFGENNRKLHKNEKFIKKSCKFNENSFFKWLSNTLFELLRKPINLFFVITSVVSMIPFSEESQGLMMLSFMINISISLILKGLAFYKKNQDSLKKSKTKVKKLVKNDWSSESRYKLKPGDIIRVNKDEEVPCDMVLIKTSNENGLCFADYRRIEGPSPLKEKVSLSQLQRFKEENYINSLIGKIRFKDSKEINEFKGEICFHGDRIIVDFNNFLNFGSVVKNTDYIVGIVIYTENNSRLSQNLWKTKNKISNLLQNFHKFLSFILLFYFFVCIAISFCHLVFNLKKQNEICHFTKDSRVNSFFKTFIMSLVRFSNLIPISLYPCLEIMNLIKTLKILSEKDQDSRIKIKIHNEILDDLGKTRMIFADKIGFSSHRVVVMGCLIDGSVYGSSQIKNNVKFSLNGDNRLVNKLVAEETDVYEKERIMDFLVLLNVCHEVKIEKNNDTNDIVYSGDTEEVAMLKAVKQVGIELIGKENSEITICNTLYNMKGKYEILAVLPYDNVRNRVSVMIRDFNSNRIILMTKGPENSMLDAINFSENEGRYVKNANRRFDGEGLKVVVLAKKYVEEEVFEEWLIRANYSGPNTKRNSSLIKCYQELEKDMDFVGSVYLDLYLEDEVVNSLTSLNNIGIKTWILSNDSVSNLEKYAKVARLIENTSRPLYITGNRSFYSKNISEFLSSNEIKDPTNKPDNPSRKLEDFYVVIEGQSFEEISNDNQLLQTVINLGIMGKTTLCCMFSPNQKAKMLRLTKNLTNWITVAVGEYLSDAQMLSEATVAISMQCNTILDSVSDICISRFVQLENLILKHGRDSYINLSNAIIFLIYRNFVVVLGEILFCFYNGFSIQNYYPKLLLYYFTGLCNSIPVIASFSCDRTLEFHKLRKFPVLFQIGLDNVLFNVKRLVFYILNSIFHSTLVFFLTSHVLSYINKFNHWERSTLTISVFIKITSFKLLTMTEVTNSFSILVFAVSIIFYYFILIVISTSDLNNLFGEELLSVFFSMFSEPAFYYINLFVFLLAILPDLACIQLQEYICKSPEKEIKSRILFDSDFKSTFIDNKASSSKDIIKFQRLYSENMRNKNREKEPSYQTTTAVNLNNVKTSKHDVLTMENDNSALVLKENTISNNTQALLTVENQKESNINSAHFKQDSSSRECTRNYVTLFPRTSTKSKCNSESRTKDKNTSSTILKLNDTLSNYENIVFIGKHSSRNTVTKHFDKNLFELITKQNHAIDLPLFTVKEKVNAENTFNNSSYNCYSSSNPKNSPMAKSNLKESEVSSGDFKKDSIQPSETNSNAKKQSITSDFQNFGTFLKHKTVKEENEENEENKNDEQNKYNYLTTFKYENNFEKIIINNEEDKNESENEAKEDNQLEKQLHEQESIVKHEMEESQEKIIKFNTKKLDATITESIRGDIQDIINAKTKEFMNSKYVSSSDDESGTEYIFKPKVINRIVELQTKKKSPSFYHNLSSNTDNSVSATTSKYYPTDHSNSIFSKNVNDSISIASKK